MQSGSRKRRQPCAAGDDDGGSPQRRMKSDHPNPQSNMLSQADQDALERVAKLFSVTPAQAALLLQGRPAAPQDVSSPEQTTSSATAYGHDDPTRGSTTQSLGNSPQEAVPADEPANGGPAASQSHEDTAVATTLLRWTEDPMSLDGQQYGTTAADDIDPRSWPPHDDQPNLALIAEAAASMADLDTTTTVPVEESLGQNAEAREGQVGDEEVSQAPRLPPALVSNDGLGSFGDPVLIHSPSRRHENTWEFAAAGRLGDIGSWLSPAIIPNDNSQSSIQEIVEEEEEEEEEEDGSGRLSCDDGNDLEVVHYEPGKRSPTHRQQRRGAFFSVKSREETANTRKLKACVRCRMQKIRCVINPGDPTGPCLTCATAVVRKVHTLACLRYKITECTLYRTGKGPGLSFSVRWPVMKLKDITDWSDSTLHNIYVSSDVCPVPLRFTVRRFNPIPKDSLHRGWMAQGVKKFTKTQPYAIVNMSKAQEDMQKYVNENFFECIDYLLKDMDCSDIAKETYAFARKHMSKAETEEEKRLMLNFFRLWFGVRRTTTDEHIMGDDTLGMKPVEDKSYHLSGKVPLPPVMIQQLDIILTLGILNPLLKLVLDDLQKIFLSNRPRSWLTIYLVTFMMLHSCALVSGENYRNARKHGLRRRYSIPQFITEHHQSANVFLSHYHYSTKPCNPFTLNWKRRQTTRFADYSPDEIRFIMRSKDLAKKHQDNFRYNIEYDLYEDELYFVAQMFEEDWTPRDTTIDFDDGTINNVPLKIYYGDPEPPEGVAAAGTSLSMTVH